ncbi:hypothetical protein ASPWEDRAFT_538677 [Aspergillus wentii DTO 134E9]|uniref:Uncharacterized protein n=1 Tax=Aspergillus wentii DTO 134E9 TaxID=1073089 RepID=A0A1L9RMU2_ASPWE|nr:uncharacterized protein ASPWEDRAFT_538677 [Aspergillus wentii DTO 134E9]OJJ36269.1 hypothetical protein ASPWEDRAFT_538677 [Aspergillus wentii DTO 134E9]
MPALFHRDFDLSPPKWEFSDQWTNPSDIFTALLILGGDGVEVAKAVDSLLGVALSQLLFRSVCSMPKRWSLLCTLEATIFYSL